MMYIVRKSVIWIMTGLLLITLMAGSGLVYADETDIGLYSIQTVRDNEYSYIELVASEQNELLGFSGTFEYDREAFAFAGMDVKNGFYFSMNEETGIVSCYSADPVTVYPGDILCAMQLKGTELMDSAETYPVSVTITEAYGKEMEDYSWVPLDLKADYCNDETVEITYTPEHNDQVYIVTYLDDNGSILFQQSLDVEDAVVEPYEPEREGYVFSGWKHGSKVFNEEKPLTGDITLRAVWKEADESVSSAADNSDNTSAVSGSETTAPVMRSSKPVIAFVCAAAVALAVLIIILLARRNRKP